jgi:endonuclease YncB( thermonuclease family)
MARPFVLAAILAGLWPTLDPALVEPPAFLSAAPERVAHRFTPCGRGRGHACVIDGDTFKLGKRKIRIVGIDAPETHGANCPEEARLGQAATVTLMRLLNQGPFTMTGRIDDMTDRYGRELKVVTRTRPDGSIQSIAEEMRASGLAHRYVGRKTSWCD